MSSANEMKKGYKISFVMPAYDEEGNIRAAIKSANEALDEPAQEYEIIVVNDGSKDATGKILDEIRVESQHLRVIHHPENRGYGAALRSGFLAAKYPLIFYTDSDNQFDIKELKNLLPMSEKYHIVAGYRINRQDPTIRLFLSWGFNLLVRLIFHIPVRDVDCSFKLFHREIFDTIKIESNDFFVDTEILAKAMAQGCSITEIGVKHFPRRAGRTTVRPSDIPRTLRELFRIRHSIRISRNSKLIYTKQKK